LQIGSNKPWAWDRELSAQSSKRGSWVSDLGSGNGGSREDPHNYERRWRRRAQEVGEEHTSSSHTDPWTAVTSDNVLTEHLLSIYFCWEYPIFASLCRHFLTDFRTRQRRYCSSLLVNAVLARGYLFSGQPGEGTGRAVMGE
jgi:hypothetical protein